MNRRITFLRRQLCAKISFSLNLGLKRTISPCPAVGSALFCPTLFSFVVLALLGINYFAAFGDLDYTWQIRTGQKILATGDLSPVDSFTYTIAGKRVPEFEGLYEAGLAIIWQTFGYGGLKLLKTILVALPLVLLCLRLRQRAVPWHHVMAAARRGGFRADSLLEPATLLLHDARVIRDYLDASRSLLRPPAAAVVFPGDFMCLGQFASWSHHWTRTHLRSNRLGMVQARFLQWNKPLDKAQCLRLSIVGGVRSGGRIP